MSFWFLLVLIRDAACECPARRGLFRRCRGRCVNDKGAPVTERLSFSAGIVRRCLRQLPFDLSKEFPHGRRELGEDVRVHLRRQVGHRVDEELPGFECRQLKTIPNRLTRAASKRLAAFSAGNHHGKQMLSVAKGQVDENAPLILAFVCQDECEFRRHAFAHDARQPLEPFRKFVRVACSMNRSLMDHGAVEMIVESDPQNWADGIMKPDDPEADGYRGRYGHQKKFLGLGLCRLPETIANAPFQTWRYGYFAHRVFQPFAHIPALLCLLCAQRATPEMLHHIEIAFRQEFIVDVGIEFGSKLLARLIAKFCVCHKLLSFGSVLPTPYARASPARCFRRSPRPRLRRDITVPIGIERISATSLYANSSTSTRRTTERKSDGIWSSAARISPSVISCPTAAGCTRLASRNSSFSFNSGNRNHLRR